MGTKSVAVGYEVGKCFSLIPETEDIACHVS